MSEDTLNNKMLDLLKDLIENRQEIYERLAPKINIVNIFGNTYHEVSNSLLLYNIFNIHFKYYNKEINFAKDFSLYIFDKYILGNKYKDKIKKAKFEGVFREYQTKEGRKIDILIVFDTFEIIIENKINAYDQYKQLEDYYNDRKNEGKDIFLVYLTTRGYEPSEYSIEKETKEKLKNKICYLSHGNIAEWIENDILKNYKFLKFDEKYQSIYSALIQIRDNEKIITNTNEENNMEKEEIKKIFEENKYFETLLNEDEPITDSLDKLNKFYRLLENTKGVISDRISDKKVEFVSEDIKYYSNIYEHIEQYIKNNNIDADIKTKEEVKDRFYVGNDRSLNMIIPKGKNWHIRLEQSIYWHFCLTVYSNDDNIKNKLKEEPIKNQIKEILDNCEEGAGGERYYVYFQYIDNTKDPKDTVNKIIKLYDLLKEKIV